MRAALTIMITASALLLSGGVQGASDFPPSYFGHSAPIKTGIAKRSFLSSTLGSNMVLQRAPQKAVVWGFVASGTAVTTEMDGVKYVATASADGVWKQALPATQASSTPRRITFTASTGENATMENVLFGDVYAPPPLCALAATHAGAVATPFCTHSRQRARVSGAPPFVLARSKHGVDASAVLACTTRALQQCWRAHADRDRQAALASVQ